ncbi:MAG: 30S ribosome-binding factor RbfA [Lentisphaerae bacterium]|nr:30S ribosome-binding factor RbfA [Lentisphaerota bacterium]
MSVDRLTRVNELLKREIGDLLFRVMPSNVFDLAAVTVTRVATSRNLREARVYVSILGHEAERPRLLALLNKRRGELQRRINKDIVLKYTPRLTFELDASVEEGDRVLTILAKLEPATTPPQP